MKTYRIKPLEWVENSAYKTQKSGVFRILHPTGGHIILMVKNVGGAIYYDCKTIKSAKAKAQELHEQELLKYLEPTE